MADRSWIPYADFRVIGRPATFATAHEAAWKAAVRTTIAREGLTVADSRFRVEITFFTATPTRSDERWDIDNLAKPTLDAMEGIFGKREWRGVAQPRDDRVDELVLVKRAATTEEATGARIQVWVLHED